MRIQEAAAACPASAVVATFAAESSSVGAAESVVNVHSFELHPRDLPLAAPTQS